MRAISLFQRCHPENRGHLRLTAFLYKDDAVNCHLGVSRLQRQRLQDRFLY